MSAKSIGYSAIALTNGTYTSAQITINGEGQITKLRSQTITPSGEELLDDYDALVALVDNSTSREGIIQNDLVVLQDVLIPELTDTSALLTSQVNDLQAQYDLLEAEYNTLNTRFTPTLVMSFTPEELDLPNLIERENRFIMNFTLPSAGKYSIFLNAVGTLNYAGNATYPLPAQPPNPLQVPKGFIAFEDWGLNTMSATFKNPSGVVLGAITTTQYSDQGTTGSTTASPNISLCSVIAGSTTIEVSGETQITMNLQWCNTAWVYFSNGTQPLLMSAGGSTTINNVPVEQAGKSFLVWKVSM